MEIVSMIYSLFIVVFLIVITGRIMVWLLKKTNNWLAMFALFCIIVFIVFFIHHFPAGTF